MQSLGFHHPFRDSTAPFISSGCGCLRDRDLLLKNIPENTLDDFKIHKLAKENQSNHGADTSWLCSLGKLHYLLEHFLISEREVMIK